MGALSVFYVDRLGSSAFLRDCLILYKSRQEKAMKKVGILMGSDSDLPVVQKAMDTLQDLEVPFEVHVYSAHRTPKEVREFTENARANGFGAIICAAGKAAHLAGAVAAGIDSLAIADVLGCVAGDDTIIVAARNDASAKLISERIRVMMKAS
jgi:NCAIR mutase (PurE)-related protein